MSPILEISDLSVAYRTPGGDVRAVEHVSLTLNAGEVVGLCGESGRASCRERVLACV